MVSETPVQGSAKGLKLLHKEIKQLLAKPIEGIEVCANEADLFTLSAIIQGPDGCPYTGGNFSIKLVFTEGYPQIAPKGINSEQLMRLGQFVTLIFHPNVSPSTGDICLSTLQKDWRPDLGLPHLLLTIKSLLMTPNPESALNEVAGKMLLEDYDGFCKHAAMLTNIHATKKSDDQENQRDEKAPVTIGNSLAETRRKLRRL